VPFGGTRAVGPRHNMKPRFQAVAAAKITPIVEAREACAADRHENKADLVIGGTFDYCSCA
jgi:hypothetical protein